MRKPILLGSAVIPIFGNIRDVKPLEVCFDQPKTQQNTELVHHCQVRNPLKRSQMWEKN